MTMAEKLDLAVRMAKAGESHASIVRATGLRAEQVQEIKRRVRP